MSPFYLGYIGSWSSSMDAAMLHCHVSTVAQKGQMRLERTRCLISGRDEEVLSPVPARCHYLVQTAPLSILIRSLSSIFVNTFCVDESEFHL